MKTPSIVRLLLCSIAFFAAVSTANAVPAYPGLLTMTQPDGSQVKVRLYGDERSHYYTTEQGIPLIEVNGAFHFAVINAQGEVQPGEIYTNSDSGRKNATAADARIISILKNRISVVPARHPYVDKAKNTPARYDENNGMNEPDTPLPGLFPGSDFPTLGSPKVLVILVQFSDVQFSTPTAPETLRKQITYRNYTDRGFTGSVLDYYATASMEQFTPQFDVLGPVQLSGTQKYYGENLSNGNDRAREMVVEACNILSATVDFSQYDNNGDGYVDNVYVIYAGRGEASGGGPDTIWPHSWYIPDEMTPTLNGVKLYSYACGNELTISGGAITLDGIGTFCHEFGHVIGLPDLYSTRYNCDNHPGGWALMASGSYLNNSRTPPTLSSWERAALSWLTPTVLRTTGDYTLDASLLTTNQAYLIPTAHSNEYFIMENRQNGSNDWDQFVPSWGMLVWHIDYDPVIWNYNIVNDDARHQYANIVEAHGDDLGGSGKFDDCFPSLGHNAFTETTKPALKAWDGSLTDITLPSITENDETYAINFTTASHSGVATISTQSGITFRTSDMTLYVEGAEGETVTLYAPDGSIAAKTVAGTAIQVPARGIYIVRCATEAVKILF